jgi:TorA maturation chaperone TorD
VSEPTPTADSALGDVPANADLAAAARLFGRLLVKELDAATLTELRAPDIQAALTALGIELPSDEQRAELGNRYFDLFLHPEGALPPVQSLWRDGQYDGNHAVGVRKIADAANRELATGARSAAPDHLGCILLLWAELQTERPELAKLLTTHHFAWAELALQHATIDEGFYGAVSRATVSLVRELITNDD